jgi:hypothetical protein
LDIAFIMGMVKVGDKANILLDIDNALITSEVAALLSF